MCVVCLCLCLFVVCLYARFCCLAVCCLVLLVSCSLLFVVVDRRRWSLLLCSMSLCGVALLCFVVV